MADEERMLCPTCNGRLTYVRELTREERESGIRSGGDRFSVPLDSHISSCPEHGFWRVFISGRVEPFTER